MRASRIATVVVPPAALAVLGLAHPVHLADDPLRWTVLHVVALPLFPLLGLAPWLLLRERSPRLAVLAAVLGYGYAAGYTALDVLAGIGAGALALDGRGGQPVLYHWANAIALPAVWAYLVASALAAVVLVRERPHAVGGAVLVLLGAGSFLTSHIYPWRGVVTMAVLAIGWGLLAASAGRQAPLHLRVPTGARALGDGSRQR